MALLQDEDVQFLKESFTELQQPVTLTLVRKERSRLILPGAEPTDEQPDATEEIRMLLGEIAAINPQIKLEERAPEDGELVPAIVFSSASARGSMRYVGLPAGYEMSTLVSTILDLGVNEELVPPEVVQQLDALPKPVRLEVFVTPS